MEEAALLFLDTFVLITKPESTPVDFSPTIFQLSTLEDLHRRRWNQKRASAVGGGGRQSWVWKPRAWMMTRLERLGPPVQDSEDVGWN